MPSRSASNRQTPHIVRICIDGWVYQCDNQPSNFSNAKTILRKALRETWPTVSHKTDITVLPGGFIFDEFPQALASLKSGWKSQAKDFEELTTYGEKCLRKVFVGSVLARLAERTKYLTVGVDLKNNQSDKTGPKTLKCPHFELVAVLKLMKSKATAIAWTGKSYPTGPQEKSLIQVVDLNTHCIEIGKARTLVLGCHDLNMFSPRVLANPRLSSFRRERCRKMRRIARKFDPTIVIQHPHQTDSSKIWRTAWSGVESALPSAPQRLSGIAYFPIPGREKLPIVLDRTQFGPSIDDVVVEGFK